MPIIQAVPLPENISFELGASLGIAAMTAHYCLFADGDISGRKVLVQGGAGVVGEAAIQLLNGRERGLQLQYEIQKTTSVSVQKEQI